MNEYDVHIPNVCHTFCFCTHRYPKPTMLYSMKLEKGEDPFNGPSLVAWLEELITKHSTIHQERSNTADPGELLSTLNGTLHVIQKVCPYVYPLCLIYFASLLHTLIAFICFIKVISMWWYDIQSFAFILYLNIETRQNTNAATSSALSWYQPDVVHERQCGFVLGSRRVVFGYTKWSCWRRYDANWRYRNIVCYVLTSLYACVCKQRCMRVCIYVSVTFLV